jgi:transposase
MFAHGEKNTVIARKLRVTERSVERWRRVWREGGTRALHSQGPPALPKLGAAQFARLEAELEPGPLAHGFADQRWTLMRIKTLIGRMFHIGYTASNESFSSWTKTFTDPRLCAAIVDRLTFGGNIIETGSDSYRLAHTKARQQAAASA